MRMFDSLGIPFNSSRVIDALNHLHVFCKKESINIDENEKIKEFTNGVLPKSIIQTDTNFVVCLESDVNYLPLY